MNREACIAVNRFGLGAAPGELAEAAGDPRGWLLGQLGRQPAHPPLAQLRPSGELVQELTRARREVQAARRNAQSEASTGMDPNIPRPKPAAVPSVRRRLRPILLAELGARFEIAATTRAPFRERLTWFWANHFSVSAAKLAVLPIAGAFEREAIRPHLDGRFVDMLVAVAQHPAMLLYLDNHLSVRPGFQAPRRPGDARPQRVTGINENLAREILELHTLGVDGGYTQADVTTFARALTGWTVAVLRDGRFRFAPPRHDPGPKNLLGRTYTEEGRAQGEAILRDLADHPATARHLATKLVRHFVADDPPPAAVARIERAYRESGGSLPAVHAALVDVPQVWEHPLAKVKQPVEFVVSVLRALPAVRDGRVERFVGALRQMGQPPGYPPSPQGWPDTAAAWVNADGLWKRIEWATALAGRLGSSVDVLALAGASYGPLLTAATRGAVARAESAEQALALWLASPEFQRR